MSMRMSMKFTGGTPRFVSLLALALLALSSSAATANTTPGDLADRARRSGEVLRELLDTPDRRIPEDLVARSRCIAVVPNVFRVAFIAGGRYGKGLLSCRAKTGDWSPPVHVMLTGGSFGLQAGASSSDVVLFFMTSSSVRAILSNKVSLGGEAGVAAGPVGRQTEAATDGTFQAQIYSYARSRGLFAGVSLAGGYLGVDRDDTRLYYGKSWSAESILFDSKVTSMPKSAWSFVGALPRARGAKATASKPVAPAVGAAAPVAPSTATGPASKPAAPPAEPPLDPNSPLVPHPRGPGAVPAAPAR